jgi:hydroxymethylglutaryl-CoA lyase
MATTRQSTERVFIHEVASRDGFQIETNFIPTADKIRFINALSHTGLAKIEVTSFVSPKAIPHLRDAEEVMKAIERVRGVTYVALVPNARGAERALMCKADELNVFMSASETHNRANVNRTTEQSLAGFKEVMDAVRGANAQTKVHMNASLSTCFGCPFEGDVPAERVLAFAERCLEMGMHGVTLADTTGMANPRQVRELVTQAVQHFGADKITLHFHNTRGMGLANVVAGLEAGVSRYDASLGGLGGCPFAPGATGNICTEDLVHMLHAMGYNTGVDLDKLLAVARGLPAIVGHDVPGQVAKAGKSTDLHPTPEGLRV